MHKESLKYFLIRDRVAAEFELLPELNAPHHLDFFEPSGLKTKYI